MILKKLPDPVFDILPVLISWWEIQMQWINIFLARWQGECVADVNT
jgi:hypothetical protein